MTPEQVAEARDAILAEHDDGLCRWCGANRLCTGHELWVNGVVTMAARVIAALESERVCKRCGGTGRWWTGTLAEPIRERCPACGGTGQETP